jgi:glycosyltransferase involved in cell wall biosynthesis
MIWSICIFAHNEERLLPSCIAALDAAAAGGDYAVHVLENGSTDRTVEVARALAAADSRITVHELSLGDKANAWNEYVHRIAPRAEMHVFVDGDVRPSRGAFRSLAFAFEGSPKALGAAALPTTGRSRRAWAAKLFREHYISGNLYALKGAAIEMLRQQNIMLPVGAFGEDGIITYILLTDFKGGPDDSHRTRIAVASGAHFEFDSLEANPRDAAIFRRRMNRYSQRWFQNQILYPKLKREGLGALPDSVAEIFTLENLAPMRPRFDPQHFFVDRATLRRLRAEACARR